MANPLLPKRCPPRKFFNKCKSPGILDDFAVRKVVETQEFRVSNVWHAYGGFQDQAAEIAIATQNIWYHITNATNDLWTGTEANGITLLNDVMTFEHSGDYIGSVSLSMTGTNGKDFQIRVYNITKGTAMGYHIGATTFTAGNFSNVSVPLYLEVNAGDELRMEVRCITDNSNPTFKNAIFHVTYLHE